MDEKLEIDESVLDPVPNALADVYLRAVREVLLPAEVLPVRRGEDAAVVVVVDANCTESSLKRYRCL